MNLENTKLHRTLGPVQLWGIAVGLVISGDYFGWNFGWSVAGFWEFAIAVFLIAIFYICFALCFTELSSSIPHAGGPAAYAEHAFGRWGGFISGYFVLCEFALAPPAIASALGGYFHFLFPVFPMDLSAIGFFILLVGINLLGVKQTARFELFVTIVAVIGLMIYLAAIAPFFSISNFPPLPQIHSLSFSSIFLSIPFAIWFFLAVEGVAMSAEEVKNPPRDIPLGYAAGIGTLILFASSIFITTAGVIQPTEISKIEYPLSFVLQKIYGEGAPVSILFTFIGLFGLIASLFGIILGYSRLVYALSVNQYLPKILAKVSRHNFVPNHAVISGGVIGLICLFLGNTAELITASALGACGMYVVSMLAYFKLKFKEPNRNRPYTAPYYPVVPGIALVLGVFALFSVAYSNIFISTVLGMGLFLGFIFFRLREKKKIYTRN